MLMLSNTEIEIIADKVTDGMTEPESGWNLRESATCCIYWCLVHKAWRLGLDLGMTKKEAIRQLHDGPLSGRSIGSIEPKTMNVTASAQELLNKGTKIFSQGRYKKRGTDIDLGPMVCKGYAPAANRQRVLDEILLKALLYFDLTIDDDVHEAPNYTDLEKVAGLLRELHALPDERQPGDANRYDRFRVGWSDAIDQHRISYGKASLNRVTWQNLGYRLGLLFGARSTEWIAKAFEHLSMKWNDEHFVVTHDAALLDRLASEYALIDLPFRPSYQGPGSPPEKLDITSVKFKRCPRVVATVLDASNGRCDLCEQEAPFTKADGAPYLEVHHVVHLAQGGLDQTSNAVALCPNCHRKCHHSPDAPTLVQKLYSKIARLIK